GEGCRGGLIDDAQHLEASDLAGVLGRLTLGVVEVGRNGNHGLRDWMAEVSLSRLLHLLENEGRDLLRRVLLAVLGRNPSVTVGPPHDVVGYEPLVLLDHRIVVAPTDETLDREESVLWIRNGLTLRREANESLPVIRKRHNRGRRVHAFGV